MKFALAALLATAFAAETLPAKDCLDGEDDVEDAGEDCDNESGNTCCEVDDEMYCLDKDEDYEDADGASVDADCEAADDDEDSAYGLYAGVAAASVAAALF
eukprot:NODE_8250_length_410_cov_15.224377_g7777_i0.p1 GENE.NODE_8250_length_410_cov_15.224377_g7777_i0~~NODE_8250_length_410_cov_15.224377_g7777_i0.p1  ORF type:complete len:101 (+),score=36.50 NODE_8250_length_410_cov_15.224377_g7777_i0:50-352(+)